MEPKRLASTTGVTAALLVLLTASLAFAQAAITTDKSDYSAGDTVIVTGRDWAPTETVSLTFLQDPARHEPVVVAAVSDEFGGFVSPAYVVTNADSATRFTLIAAGQTSGLTAQALFIDSPWVVLSWDPLLPGQMPNPVKPGNTVTYLIKIKVATGSPLEVNLGIQSGLPAGAMATFSPNPVYFSGGNSMGSSTLTITTSAGTPLGDHAVTFRAEKVGGPSDYYDHTAILSVRNVDIQIRPIINPVGDGFSYFGRGISDAGDFNGDGYPDVIVGASGYASYTGRAYLYFGGPAADSSPDLVLDGPGVNWQFGLSVSSAGDFNGDGYADVIVGGSGPLNVPGRAWVYYGGSSPDGAPDLILTGEVSGDGFGNAVGSAGDVNSDGIGDVIVGAQVSSIGGYRKGRAYVYYGGAIGDSNPDLIYTIPGAMYIGSTVASIGDVNGDGRNDLAIGASRWGNGYAFVYFGGSIPDTTPDLTIPGQTGGEWFGCAIAGAGDVNADGYGDVIVGALRSSADGLTNAGRVYIFCGGPAVDNTPDIIIRGTEANAQLGVAVDAVDVSGDTHPDVIAAPGYSSAGGSQSGRVNIYFGGPSLDAVADMTITGEAPGDCFGADLASVGDFNADGYPDLVIGAMAASGTGVGQAYVFSFAGATGSVTGDVTATCPTFASGMAGIAVQAYLGGPGQALMMSTETNASGAYSLGPLAVGNYWIRIHAPSGFATTGNDVPVTVTGSGVSTQNFGLLDVAPPVPSLAALPDAVGVCSATIASTPNASDNCMGIVTGSTTDPLEYAAEGTYTVHWMYSDAAGNATIQDQQVVVHDETAPSIEAPPAVTAIASNGPSGCVAFLPDEALGTATVSDNCSGDVTKARSGVPVGNLFPVGVTTLVYTATDVAGNSTTATQDITVRVCGHTEEGTGVTTAPVDTATGTSPVSLTFDQVTGSGVTSLEVSGVGQPPPSGFKLGQPPTYFEISTTAVFSGYVEVCIDYSTLSFGKESKLKLFHQEGTGWTNCTASLDTVLNIICCEVISLSSFAIFEEIPPGAIGGLVTSDCPVPGTGRLGVLVDAFKVGTGDLAKSAVTNEAGHYMLADLAAGDYMLTIVPPLGYSIETEEVLTSVQGDTVTVPFPLTCLPIPNDPRSMGFWKHQVGVATGGNGHAEIDGQTLCSYLDLIESHFNSNAINQVVVYQPPASGSCAEKLEVAKALLNLKGNAGMTARARQHLMSLLMNVAAGYIGLQQVVSADGATLSQAITYCDYLIDGPPSGHETAKTIADRINNNQIVAAGLIPLDTENIAYKTAPVARFELSQNRPNPFFQNTAIGFTLPSGTAYALTIYNMAGQRVRKYSGTAGTSEASIAWDARDDAGAAVVPGPYVYQLRAGSLVESRRMMLVR